MLYRRIVTVLRLFDLTHPMDGGLKSSQSTWLTIFSVDRHISIMADRTSNNWLRQSL